ncbi:hypothetical protein D3C87_1929460 [compost metagenome]
MCTESIAQLDHQRPDDAQNGWYAAYRQHQVRRTDQPYPSDFTDGEKRPGVADRRAENRCGRLPDQTFFGGRAHGAGREPNRAEKETGRALP